MFFFFFFWDGSFLVGVGGVFLAGLDRVRSDFRLDVSRASSHGCVIKAYHLFHSECFLDS